MSHTYITTAHTLLKDVENPIPKYADKRKRDDWTNTPIFKSGMRILMNNNSLDVFTKDEKNKHTEAGIIDIRSVEFSPDCRNSDSDYSKMHNTRIRLCYNTIFNDHVDIRWFTPAHTIEGMSAKDKKYNREYEQFAMNMLRNLSEPIRDFSSIFLNLKSSPLEIMHKMFLFGRISLDQIEATDKLM